MWCASNKWINTTYVPFPPGPVPSFPLSPTQMHTTEQEFIYSKPLIDQTPDFDYLQVPCLGLDLPCKGDGSKREPTGATMMYGCSPPT